MKRKSEAAEEEGSKRPRSNRGPVFKEDGKKLLLSGKIATDVRAQRSFQGVPTTNDQYLELIVDDCLTMTPRLAGKPVIMNHGRSSKNPARMGTIIESDFDAANNDWWIQFELDTEHPGAKALQQLVESGQTLDGLFGLSLSHHYDSKEPTEVSLTFDPAREGSWVQLNPQEYNAQPAENTLIQASRQQHPENMATQSAQPMETSTPPAATTTRSGKDTKDSMDTGQNKGGNINSEFQIIEQMADHIKDPEMQKRFLQMQLDNKTRLKDWQNKATDAEVKARATEERLKKEISEKDARNKETSAAFLDAYVSMMHAKKQTQSPEKLQRIKQDLGNMSDHEWLGNVAEGLVTASKVYSGTGPAAAPHADAGKSQPQYSEATLLRVQLLKAYEDEQKKSVMPFTANQQQSNSSHDDMLVNASRQHNGYQQQRSNPDEDVLKAQMRAMDNDERSGYSQDWRSYAPSDILKQLGDNGNSSSSSMRDLKRRRD